MRVVMAVVTMLVCVSNSPSGQSDRAPNYLLDPAWPRLPLPNHWAIGHVVGASMDRHRPAVGLRPRQLPDPGIQEGRDVRQGGPSGAGRERWRVFDLAFSRDPGQRFVFVSDARTNTVWILRRSDMKTLGSIGSNGHWPGQFTMAHSLAVDSSNNLYVTEGASGQRIQRFLFKGLKKAATSN